MRLILSLHPTFTVVTFIFRVLIIFLYYLNFKDLFCFLFLGFVLSRWRLWIFFEGFFDFLFLNNLNVSIWIFWFHYFSRLCVDLLLFSLLFYDLVLSYLNIIFIFIILLPWLQWQVVFLVLCNALILLNLYLVLSFLHPKRCTSVVFFKLKLNIVFFNVIKFALHALWWQLSRFCWFI